MPTRSLIDSLVRMLSHTSPAPGFLAHFNDQDQAWLQDAGTHQPFLAAQTIADAGVHPEHLYMVQEGVVGVYQRRTDGRNSLLARRGAGDILGEVRWLNPCAADAESLVAQEPVILLAWPRAVLEDRLGRDPHFSSAFYRAVAFSCAQTASDAQGRESLAALGSTEAGVNSTADLHARVQAFKDLMAQADKAALRNDGAVPGVMLEQAKLDFQELMVSFNALMGAGSAHSPQEKEALGGRVQKEFLPYLSLTETADRFYSKPRGYAGDFLTIARIYDDKPGGAGRIGPLVDACFLGTPAAAAVRNRRHLLRSLIDEVLNQHPGETTRITSLACGPAQELFDVYATLNNPSRLRSSLIDIDLQALAYVMDKATRHKVDRFIAVFNNNLLYLATGRQTIQLPPQDLIYSIGLIDYFGDKFVVQLLNFAHDHLKPGGSVVLGNFHPVNPNKAFMDHILDWKLIHRDEQDMHRLFGLSKFGKDADQIHFEQEGINLFAQCYKAGQTT